MPDDWIDREAAYFVRLEARMVDLDLRVDALESWKHKYEPIVDGLKERDMLAEAIAKKVQESHRSLLTWVNIVVALLAITVPPFLAVLAAHWLYGGR